MLAITAGCLALSALCGKPARGATARHGVPLEPRIVARTLAFALPAVFVTLASSSLYIAMVPAFLEPAARAIR